MNKLLLASILLLTSGSLYAQNKLNPAAISMLEEYENAPAEARTAASEVSAIVTLRSAADIRQIEALGFNVSLRLTAEDMILVDLPLDRVNELTEQDCVVSVTFGNKANALMDIARKETGVDDIHAATAGLDRAYTGAGVVCGLFDVGLYTNHINFKAADGSRRVKAVNFVSGTAAKETVYEDNAVGNFSTDDNAESHGTHVLGIMAGGYKGEVTQDGKNTKDNPYYGVATGSDIVAGCGDLYDNNIIKGVEYIARKAKEMGKPAVINLSIGYNIGSHDGKDAFSRSISALAKDNVIVMAAGNEGQVKMGVSKNLTASDNKLATSVFPMGVTSSTSVKKFSGTAQFYSDSSKPVKFRLFVLKRVGNQTISEYILDTNTAGKATYVGGEKIADKYKGVALKNFDVAFGTDSYVKVSSNIDANSERYMINCDYQLDFLSTALYLGFEIEGSDGQIIKGYTSSTTRNYTAEFSSRGVSDWEDGSQDGTISTMCCSPDVIVIGSYSTRSSWPTFNGSYSFTDATTIGDYSTFSSYGTLVDGRKLPHLCAPGKGILSSYSTPWIQAGYENPLLTSARFDESRFNTYYWGQMSGTSMAAPFAAGVFALWLEANPNLTPSQIRDIAIETARKDLFTQKDKTARWGAGKIDPVAGLKRAIQMNGLNDITVNRPSILVNESSRGIFDIFASGASGIKASVYSLSGAAAATASANGDQLDFDLTSLAAGVYVLTVEADGLTETRKIALR